MSEEQNVIDYDPNKFSLSNKSVHTVKLVFGVWEYRAEEIREVSGNCSGLDVITSAIDSFYEDLPELEGTKIPYLMLTDKDGNMLECADDEEDCYDFLPRMLMSAEIIGFTSMK